VPLEIALIFVVEKADRPDHADDQSVEEEGDAQDPDNTLDFP